MSEILVGASSEIPESARRIVSYGEQEIGVIRIAGRLHAFLNVCPHQGGPVCQGMLIHKVEEVVDSDRKFKGMKFSDDKINLVCPWHGWEFDIETGRCAGDGKQGVRKFAVREEEGKIYVVIG
ncbi:nitrite reductase (NADH) small subunit [Bradyrhizobium sp. AZCC 1678]|uniref:Rieske (2Fe-2S) protein n=1 Tax=Bradyrhizobium sp. AZCC 1678 TaxID=3117030 RepID=UPI002FEF4CFF